MEIDVIHMDYNIGPLDRAIVHANELLEGGIKPKGFRHMVLSQLKKMRHKRTLAYLAIFEHSAFSLATIYSLRNDQRFTYQQLRPLFEQYEAAGMFHEDIMDADDILSTYYENYKASGLTKEDLQKFQTAYTKAIDAVPNLQSLLDRETFYKKDLYEEAKKADLSYTDYLESDAFKVYKKEEPDDFSDWLRNTLAKKFSTLQKQVVDVMTDEKHLIRDTVAFYDEGLQTPMLLDRKAYRAFIQSYGTGQEKKVLERMDNQEQRMRERALVMDEYLVYKSDLYTHAISQQDLQIPYAYTGTIYTVGLRMVPNDGRYLAKCQSFVAGELQETVETVYFEALEELDDFLEDVQNAPIFLIESGNIEDPVEQDDLQNALEFVETSDYSFEEARDDFWDNYWVTKEA